jgi:uncharacterized protein
VDHPLLLLLLTFGGVIIGKLWRDDVCAARQEIPRRNAFPGATAAPIRAVAIAVLGALVILGLETWGETALGLREQQSRMTWLFAAYSVVSAPIIEELVFRGWLVVDSPRRALTWAAAIATSLLFAALHPYLWRWDDAGFAVTLTAKGGFSFGVVFVTSVWLYAARLAGWNPSRSLLPCFAAHAAKNAGVVAIKAAMGFVIGAW